jgi:hypothetical protein
MSKRETATRALDALHEQHQKMVAAAYHEKSDPRLSRQLLEEAISAGARADQLRGRRTWEQLMEDERGV